MMKMNWVVRINWPVSFEGTYHECRKFKNRFCRENPYAEPPVMQRMDDWEQAQRERAAFDASVAKDDDSLPPICKSSEIERGAA